MTWSECLVEAVRLLRLGELTSITSGFPFKSEFFGASGTIPVVRNRDVARGYSTTFYSGHYTQEFVVKDGDLLVSMDGDFRAERWKGGMAVLNQRVCRISPDPSLLDPDFLRFFLPRRLQLIQDATPFATVKHLSVKTIAEIKVPLHPLAEQRRIAAVLDKADGIRQKRRESLRLLDQFLGSAFLEMFGDPVRNEKGWEAVPLGEIGEIQGGLQVTPQRMNLRRHVPYLRVANVYRDRLDLREVKNLGVNEGELARVQLQSGDLLIVEGHGNREEIGRSAVWDGSIETCVHQNHLIRARLHRARAEPSYVSAFLNSAGGRRQLVALGKTTSGLNTISTTNVKRVRVILPPVRVQRRYAEQRSRVLASSDRVEAARIQGERLFDSLAERAFSGEVY